MNAVDEERDGGIYNEKRSLGMQICEKRIKTIKAKKWKSSHKTYFILIQLPGLLHFLPQCIALQGNGSGWMYLSVGESGNSTLQF